MHRFSGKMSSSVMPIDSDVCISNDDNRKLSHKASNEDCEPVCTINSSSVIKYENIMDRDNSNSINYGNKDYINFIIFNAIFDIDFYQ